MVIQNGVSNEYEKDKSGNGKESKQFPQIMPPMPSKMEQQTWLKNQKEKKLIITQKPMSGA